MYKQHVTSPVPYIFIRLSDIEDKHYKHALLKLFYILDFLFSLEGTRVVTDNSRDLQTMKCVFLSL